MTAAARQVDFLDCRQIVLSVAHNSWIQQVASLYTCWRPFNLRRGVKRYWSDSRIRNAVDALVAEQSVDIYDGLVGAGIRVTDNGLRKYSVSMPGALRREAGLS